MFNVYVLKSEEGKYYVGQTNNVQIRLRQHNEGLKGFTKKYKNWKIIQTEEFETRKEAIRREREIKSLKFNETFKKIFDAKFTNN